MNYSDRFTYIVIVIGFLLVGLSLFLTSWEPDLLLPYGFFCVLMVGYRLVKVRLLQGLYMTFTPLLIFVGMFLLGPAPMAVILSLGILSTRLFGIYMRSAVFNTGQFVISMYASYLVYSMVGGKVPLTYLDGPLFWKMMFSTLVFMVVNVLLVYTSDLLSNACKIQKFLPKYLLGDCDLGTLFSFKYIGSLLQVSISFRLDGDHSIVGYFTDLLLLDPKDCRQFCDRYSLIPTD